MTYADHLQIQAMEERAKESQAKEATIRDKDTGVASAGRDWSRVEEKTVEAGVSPKPVAQKITTDDLHALISRVEYARAFGTKKTLCQIFIGNTDFSVTGESVCLNPADFDNAVERDLAFKDAFHKLRSLEGYHRMRVVDEGDGVMDPRYWPVCCCTKS